MQAQLRVARTPDGIHVSPLDERQYRHLVLCNGLQALVVSDPATESASAALDVLVGFHSDPDALPGLAHFCEHMLFLGTAKYPDENSYSAFLNAHGGSSNAYTSARDTNFYFDVSAPHLHEALDRFAQFFVAPLFTASATDREMNAVDSENTNYLQDDYWRINQAHRALGNPKHPNHRYGVGNLQTLSVTPKEQGIDVRQALLDYHEEYYSANMMKLVVYGKEDVDVLSRWVQELFSDIRNTGRAKPSFAGELPFNKEHLARRLDVVPVKDLKIVGVTWQLPPVRGVRYTQQHTSVLAHLIGHEGQGSLLSYLKKNKWVNSLSAGIDEEHDEFSLFLINLDVTEDGIAHLEDVLLALFQYLQLLTESQFEKWMFEELENLAVMHFLFQSKHHPINYTSSIAGIMQSHPKQDILTQGTLHYPYECEQIQELLHLMTPANMKLLVVCKSMEPIATSEEKWYGTKYRDTPLSTEFLQKMSTPEKNPALFLPGRNEFISSDFALVDKSQVNEQQKYPALVRDDDMCRLWMKSDVHFKKPKIHAALTFHSPLVNNSPLAYALSDLFVMCIQDELTEYAYDASLAGMHYDLAVRGSTIHLGAIGYSAKLPVLVRRIVEVMASFADHIKEETFDRVKQAACRAYENVKLEEAFRHAMHETTFFLQDIAWTHDELIAAVGQCTFAMLVNHSHRTFQQVFLEAFLYGNVTQEGTLEIANMVIEQIHRPFSLPVAESQRYWMARQINLPQGVECIYRKLDPNPDNTNCALDSVYQIGEENLLDRVKLALFSQIAQEPLFNQLRTKEQLGYTVFSTPARSNGIQFFRIILQSNVAAPEYLEQRIDAFWSDFRASLVSMDTAQFQKYIQTIVKEYSEKPKSQEEEVQFLLTEITNHEYVFDRKEVLAQLVTTLQPSDVLQFYDKHISPSAAKRKKLSVQIFGNTTPLARLQGDEAETTGLSPWSCSTQAGLLAATTLGTLADGQATDGTTKLFIDDPREFKRRATFYGLPTPRAVAKKKTC
ncbi:Insulin-degrading enzyme, partial [Globisporangium splendens]